MNGHWTHEWPKREGVYWTLAPGATEPSFVYIKGEHWHYLDRGWGLQDHDWDEDAPTLFWSAPLQPPPSPDGFRLASASRATWTMLWPEKDGLYWLFHPGRAIAIAQITRLFRGFVGTDDAWEREQTIHGEMFWDEPILPPSLPEALEELN